MKQASAAIGLRLCALLTLGALALGRARASGGAAEKEQGVERSAATAATAGGTLTKAALDSIQVCRSRAIDSYRRGRYAQALAYYQKAEAYGDSSIVPQYNQACCWGRLGKADSSICCLEKAVDRGFCDYVEMEHDRDLAPAQLTAQWAQIWGKAFANSFGKTMARLFEANLRNALVGADSAALAKLLPNSQEPALAAKAASVARELSKAAAFGNIESGKELTPHMTLHKARTDYRGRHFVKTCEWHFGLAPTLIDADVARLLPQDTFVVRTETTDDCWTWMTQIDYQPAQLKTSAASPTTLLHDSIMALTIRTRGSHVDEMETRMDAKAELPQKILAALSKAESISRRTFEESHRKGCDLCIIRLTQMPIGKSFEGTMLIFDPKGNTALVVSGGGYWFAKGKFRRLLKCLGQD